LQRFCPDLTNCVRTIAMTDPSPIPLLIGSAGTDRQTIARLRKSLIGAAQDAQARPLLDDLLLHGFAEVASGDYSITTSWARDAELAGLMALAPREEAPAIRRESRSSG
jgi:hypothetical protein